MILVRYPGDREAVEIDDGGVEVDAVVQSGRVLAVQDEGAEVISAWGSGG